MQLKYFGFFFTLLLTLDLSAKSVGTDVLILSWYLYGQGNLIPFYFQEIE